tara:strand:- start:1017 stop:1331 length:315 start_codon:yes stop_codon:yes gene_type:complete
MPKFNISPEMSDTLMGLTRELLRASTYSQDMNTVEDLSAFSFSYFMNLLQSSDLSPLNSNTLTTDELMERVGILFDNADLDGNGVLDRSEFKAVFASLKGELGE